MVQEIKKIAFSAGELSGDQHGAKLLLALKASMPNTQFAGMGGKNLAEAGLQIVIDSEKSGGINGFNLWKILTSGLGSLIQAIVFLYRWRPEVLILIDYPDFNLRLARVAKLLGIKTVYFIPPKIWAWRSKRIKYFHKSIDQVLTIFPFETEFFHQNK